MKFPNPLALLKKIPNPLDLFKLPEAIMADMIKSALLKALSSFIKGLSAALIAAFTAFAAVPIDSQDKGVLLLWGLIVSGVHAVISAIKRGATFDPSKVV